MDGASKPSVHKIARSLGQHRDLSLNYLRTYQLLELAFYHTRGKLPEPESTHDFF
jgi:hypothetical protein